MELFNRLYLIPVDLIPAGKIEPKPYPAIRARENADVLADDDATMQTGVLTEKEKASAQQAYPLREAHSNPTEYVDRSNDDECMGV